MTIGSFTTIAFIAASAPLLAQPATTEVTRKQLEYTRGHYTKYDYRIPMRDGVKLFTSVFVPKDSSQPYPILMQRTPYSIGPYGEDQYKEHLGRSDEFEER